MIKIEFEFTDMVKELTGHVLYITIPSKTAKKYGIKKDDDVRIILIKKEVDVK